MRSGCSSASSAGRSWTCSWSPGTTAVPCRSSRVTSDPPVLPRSSRRQKRLYGLKKKAFAPYLRDEMEMDARYWEDLAKDPEAQKWLSAFNEETLKGVRIKVECHVLNEEEWREANAYRVRRQRGRDPLTFSATKVTLSGALEDGWGGGDGWNEDKAIEKLDLKRAIRLREETEDGLG